MDIGGGNKKVGIDIEVNSSQAQANVAGFGNALDSFKGKAEGAASAMKLFKKALLTGLSGGLFLAGAIKSFASFDKGLREVRTLVDTTSFDMDTLTEAVKDQAIQFNQDNTSQVKAAYQIISAGAGSASQAVELLTASNKLALGGVTDVATAADGLTSVLNAYGDESANTLQVSNAFFEAMRAGKTTVDELARGIGLLAPTAAQAGIAVEETFASVSALTKAGVRTRFAITQIRQAISSIIKPTTEAAKAAKQLGVDFSLEGVSKAGGLQQFLEEVSEKTNGSIEGMSRLFTSVEALSAVAVLAGSGAQDFADTIGNIENASDSAAAAVDEMAGGAAFDLGQVGRILKEKLQDIGESTSRFVIPAIHSFVTNLDTIIDVGKIAAATMTAFFVSLNLTHISSAAKGLLGLSEALKKVAFGVKSVTIAMVHNPITAIVTAITFFATSAVILGDKIKPVQSSIATLHDYGKAAFRGIAGSVMSVSNSLTEELIPSLGGTSEALDVVNTSAKAAKVSLMEYLFSGVDESQNLLVQSLQNLSGAIIYPFVRGKEEISEFLAGWREAAEEVAKERLGIDDVSNYVKLWKNAADEIVAAREKGRQASLAAEIRKEAEAAIKRNKALAAYREILDDLERQVDTARLTQAEKTLMAEMLEIENRLLEKEVEITVEQREQIQNLIEKRNLVERAAVVTAQNETNQQKLNRALEEFNELKDRGLISEDTYTQAVKNARSQFSGLQGDLENIFEEIGNSANQWGGRIADSLANAAFTGELSFRNMATAIIRDLLRIVAHITIVRPLLEGLAPFFSGLSLFGGDGAVAAGAEIPSGLQIYRNSGGPVRANYPYIAGETRAELFVPKTSGRLEPLDKLLRGGERGDVNVSVTVNVGDAGEGGVVTELGGRGRNQQVNQFGKELGEMVARELIRHKSPGGLLYGK